MKTFTTCMQCQVETGIPNFSSFGLAEIPENGFIETVCNRGHRTATIMQEAKFEILSEMGVKAIVDASYRDAVFSFATSLERLHEHFVEAACRRHGVTPEAFGAIWKQMSNQSERQLGAFLAAYLLDTREPPKLMPQKQVEFRNAVAHKGRFPTREEAIRFGQATFDCAIPILSILRSEPYVETLRTLTFERIRERSERARIQAKDPTMPTSTMSTATPLSFATADQPMDLKAIVASYAERPDMKLAVAESHAFGAAIEDLIRAKVADQPLE